jgi:hypothetical protein
VVLTEFIYVTQVDHVDDLELMILRDIVGTARMIRFQSDAWPTTKALLPSFQEGNVLQELLLEEVMDLPCLWKFLHRCPNLENLDLNYVYTGADNYDLGPAPVLPKLRKLAGPPQILPLVPHSPVVSVNLTPRRLHEVGTYIRDPPFTPSGPLHFLKQSTAGIRSLALPIYFYSLMPIGAELPQLEELMIENMHPNYCQHDFYKNNNLSEVCACPFTFTCRLRMSCC